MSEKPETPEPTAQDEFKLERLRHVLKQQEFLNEHSHKYLTVFQTITTAIVVAAVAVFMSWKKLEIDLDVAKASILALEILLVAIGAFVILVVVTNVFSWWDYRKQETELLNSVVGSDFRDPPSLKSAWRWFETLFLILVIVVVVGLIGYFEWYVEPLMKPKP